MDRVEQAIERVRQKSRGRTRYEGAPIYDDEALVEEIERLRSSIAIKDRALREAHAQFQAIRQATLDGKVCDDVAWFSNIETLHDYCWDCEDRIEKLLGIEPVELVPAHTTEKDGG